MAIESSKFMLEMFIWGVFIFGVSRGGGLFIEENRTVLISVLSECESNIHCYDHASYFMAVETRSASYCGRIIYLDVIDMIYKGRSG